RMEVCTVHTCQGFPAATFRRDAASAMPKTCNGVLGTLSCFPVKIHKEIGSFVHTHTMKLRGFQLRREALPDRNGKILRGWNAIGKLRHFFVEEAMVHGIENFAVQDFF